MMNRKWLLTSFCAFILGVHSTTFADTEVILKDATSASGFMVRNSNNLPILNARGDGNVGIGTTVPVEPLHVHLASGKNVGFFMNALPSVGSFNDNFTAWGDLQVGLNLFSMASGNVGIGTVNPLVALHVQSASEGATALRLTDNRRATLDIDFPATSQLRFGVSAAEDILFASGGATLMTIKNVNSGGNVGIGTTNPLGKFQIHDGPDINIRISGEDFGAGGVSLNAFNDANSQHVPMQFAASKFYFNSNVGMGTTNPQYKLHVVGSAYSTGGWSSSDRRWKKDITPLANSLSNVLKLQGVHYFWKVDEYPDRGFTKDKQIGFIAQEVEGIFPELVHTDAEGYKAVSYEKLTVVLVEAVKELKAENEQVKSQNHQLSQEVAQLREEFLALKAQQESFKAMLATDINPQLNSDRKIE